MSATNGGDGESGKEFCTTCDHAATIDGAHRWSGGCQPAHQVIDPGATVAETLPISVDTLLNPAARRRVQFTTIEHPTCPAGQARPPKQDY